MLLSVFITAKANPSFFLQNQTVATTSPTFITAGVATSTSSFDLGASGAQGADSAVLLSCMTASSTNTQVAVAYEFSTDNQTWFANNLASSTSLNLYTNGYATNQNFLWNFASTSIGGGGQKGLTYDCRSFPMPTPTRYIRAILSMPTGNANSPGVAIWSNIVAKRQAY